MLKLFIEFHDDMHADMAYLGLAQIADIHIHHIIQVTPSLLFLSYSQVMMRVTMM